MKRLKMILLILAIAIFLGSGGHLLHDRKMIVKDWQNLEMLAEIVEEGGPSSGWFARLMGARAMADEAEPALAGSDGEIDLASILPQYQALYQWNSDIVGWIEIETTLVNYPVMQAAEDAEFYLHRNFDKEEAYSGLPFLDGRCDIDSPTDNLLVYGHNMKNGTMFGQLPEFTKKGFYEKHKTIQFDLLNEARTYEIVGVFLSKQYEEGEKGFRYYDYIDLSNMDRFAEYVEQVKKASLYDTGVSADWGDHLLTLSTCYYHVKGGTLVVVARHRP